MRKSTAAARDLLDSKGKVIRQMTAAEFKRRHCNKAAVKRGEAKFSQLALLNATIDAGGNAGINARKAKSKLIERDTDGRSQHERNPTVGNSVLWNPDGKRTARGRDDTQWINRKNAGKAGKFAGKGL